MIENYERVVLTENVPEKDLEKGDVGTIVSLHENLVDYKVEFLNIRGRIRVVAVIHESKLKPVEAIR